VVDISMDVAVSVPASAVPCTFSVFWLVAAPVVPGRSVLHPKSDDEPAQAADFRYGFGFIWVFPAAPPSETDHVLLD
jgi:hypothetical protein